LDFLFPECAYSKPDKTEDFRSKLMSEVLSKTVIMEIASVKKPKKLE
jgi:hypothetical protein